MGNLQWLCSRRLPVGSIACMPLHVLTLESRGIGRVVSFQDVDALRSFDLPHLLPTEPVTS